MRAERNRSPVVGTTRRVHRRWSSIGVDGRRSASIGVGAGDPLDVIGAESLSPVGCTESARRLHGSGDVRPLRAETDRKNKVMNNNDNKQETKTETETDAKPKVRIVDLEEVREVLGAAAPAPAIATAPKDTIMCSW
jgi:hypothetical protein